MNRDFTATAPGQKMVGDITYIQTWQGWLYLATVIDCYTKTCIGYTMAARNYPLAEGAIFHSDYAEPCVKPRKCGMACVGGVR